jgi:hypothetical protein
VIKKRPIDISTISPRNLLPALDSVRGCWKATTMLWMHAMGVPVLSGVIVPDWSEKSARAVRNYSRKHGVSELLLRIDRPRQRWTARRGGYLVPGSGAGEAVKEVTREGMIAMFLEPASPYCNLYALGALALPDDGKMVVEVVGSGFDASDILRSDLEPHERFEVALPPRHRFPAAKDHQVNRTFLISSAAYRESVARRLAKVGARLENPAFPDKLLNSPLVKREELISKARRYLRESGQDSLLRHETTYTPIPLSYFSRFLRGVRNLLDQLAAYGIHLDATSISSCIIRDRRLIFWDFFPAKRADTAVLASNLRDDNDHR